MSCFFGRVSRPLEETLKGDFSCGGGGLAVSWRERLLTYAKAREGSMECLGVLDSENMMFMVLRFSLDNYREILDSRDALCILSRFFHTVVFHDVNRQPESFRKACDMFLGYIQNILFSILFGVCEEGVHGEVMKTFRERQERENITFLTYETFRGSLSVEMPNMLYERQVGEYKEIEVYTLVSSMYLLFLSQEVELGDKSICLPNSEYIDVVLQKPGAFFGFFVDVRRKNHCMSVSEEDTTLVSYYLEILRVNLDFARIFFGLNNRLLIVLENKILTSLHIIYKSTKWIEDTFNICSSESGTVFGRCYLSHLRSLSHTLCYVLQYFGGSPSTVRMVYGDVLRDFPRVLELAERIFRKEHTSANDTSREKLDIEELVKEKRKKKVEGDAEYRGCREYFGKREYAHSFLTSHFDILRTVSQKLDIILSGVDDGGSMSIAISAVSGRLLECIYALSCCDLSCVKHSDMVTISLVDFSVDFVCKCCYENAYLAVFYNSLLRLRTSSYVSGPLLAIVQKGLSQMQEKFLYPSRYFLTDRKETSIPAESHTHAENEDVIMKDCIITYTGDSE